MKTKYIVCFKTLKIIPIVKLILYSMLKDSTLDSNLTFIFLVYTAKMNLLMELLLIIGDSHFSSLLEEISPVS
jgi:hypothetical protein